METKGKHPTIVRPTKAQRNISKTLRNNTRLSKHTRKILGNVRNAYQTGENIPKKFLQFLKRTVKEEHKNRKTAKLFYNNYQKYAVNEG